MPHRAVELLSKARGIGSPPKQALIRSRLASAEVMGPGFAEIPVGPGFIKSMLGPGQVIPRARDAIEMIKRLRAGVSKVPASTARQATAAISQPPVNPINTSVIEELYPTPELPPRFAGWEHIKKVFGF